MSGRGRASPWDGILPGPASRSNGGCSDCSPGGALLAYGAGSCVVIADPRSMQLVCVLPMPPASSSSSSPSPSSSPLQQQLPLLLLSPFPAASASASFVTSLRWSPQPLTDDLSSHEDPSNSHLRLAAGDRQGRIALWDLRSRQVVLWFDLDSGSRLGIQDLCWIRSDSWLLASIHGPSLLVLWDAATGRCLWKYDAAPEYLCCIRRDPFDWRHFCTLSLHGFLLSAIALGVEGDVSLQEHRINGISDPLEGFQRSEKESANSPAMVAYPLYYASLSFSPLWRNVLLVTFPRELLSFDIHYGASLSLSQLPRTCGKFLDIIPDPELDLLYCAHLDGKLSIWKRKLGEQAYVLCTMEELMPSIGSSVPSPSVLSIALCQSESPLRTVRDEDITFLSSDVVDSTSGGKFRSNKYIMVISDDGKIWQWSLDTDEDVDTRDSQKVANQNQSQSQVSEESDLGTKVGSADNGTSTSNSVIGSAPTPRGTPPGGIKAHSSKGSGSTSKMNLIGQLHLLSSTVTTLAVPSPSLLATLARGGNNPAPAVPLVALGTQSGAIDIIDIIANAVTVSFSVHNSSVRGLRWLGNSRLVSFSYSQVNDKGGGYTNRLAVICVRSGLNRPFRVLQKPERAPIRALRASSSGRYLVILFRDAPVEVWAMTKNPIMLRSLALPFTVLEWTLPAVPRPTPTQNGSSTRQSSPATSADSKTTSSDTSTDDTSESFAFALVNGALGVFEVHGRRIRDFRPKWPSSTFAPSDGLVTAMAYRLPHVVMGDRLGNIRWWDVTTGLSSSFNTHKEGIRRIKFSPVVSGDRSRGRIAVLFYDNTFSIFYLDTPDPLANSLLQPQSPGTLVLELDWLPMRTNKDEPLVLSIAGADSSFRLIEINIGSRRTSVSSMEKVTAKEIYRPMPLCAPILLPTAHALALRMILQMGVKRSWFNYNSLCSSTNTSLLKSSVGGDLRGYMIETGLPTIGDPVVPELLLKVLDPYRKEGCIIDEERADQYEKAAERGVTDRLAFAASIFGELSEALFWLQLPHAFLHFLEKSSPSAARSSSSVLQPTYSVDNVPSLDQVPSFEMAAQTSKKNSGQLNELAFKKEELWLNAKERISWHDKLDSEEAIQKRVHELVSVGNLEGAVSLLLSTPPEGPHFYPNALRAVVLSSAVSRSLHELAVKVVAANMVRTDKSLSGIHLLCAVGRYQEACSQLQDAGCWTDAVTLAATHLHGSDYSRVLHRWADYVLHYEHNIWRALILYVAAGAMSEALAALRKSKQPDTAAFFLLACHDIYTKHLSSTSAPPTQQDVVDRSGEENGEESEELEEKMKINFPGRNIEEDIATVSEFFGQYQRKLIHLCMDTVPSIE
ncbi:Transducin family protein / WD-40 repeat family protein [Rhynchospora pubera]|uniref:Transducin family protein / WD-40 repeat family protein n=1 Tax=Rhynchospora pubera TaxID=906938 RepID=A0AAV8CW82_9POAL|nr:Transducin family protein / WD-40 repeat family protein [Rhynchospora pubera]